MRVMQLGGSGPPEHGRPCVAVSGVLWCVCSHRTGVPLVCLGLRLRLCGALRAVAPRMAVS